jgi:hypothetical protein
MTDEQIFEIINSDCHQYLEILKHCPKGRFLVRGYYYDIPEIKEFKHNLEKRAPKNMPLNIHEKLNNHFERIFRWKIRNGIFCFGYDINESIPRDLGYGIFYLFFPKGNFRYVYSKEHFDLFGFINQSKENIETIINNLRFEDSNLCQGMVCRKEYDNFSNEISVNANSYYLVNPSLAKSLTSLIWK